MSHEKDVSPSTSPLASLVTLFFSPGKRFLLLPPSLFLPPAHSAGAHWLTRRSHSLPSLNVAVDAKYSALSSPSSSLSSSSSSFTPPPPPPLVVLVK